MGTLIIFFFWFLWFGSCIFFTVAAFARQQRRYGNVLQELVGICTLKCLNLFRNLSPHNPLNPSTFKSSITSYFLMQFTTRSLCYLHNLLSFSHAFHSLFALLYAAYFFISNSSFLIFSFAPGQQCSTPFSVHSYWLLCFEGVNAFKEVCTAHALPGDVCIANRRVKYLSAIYMRTFIVFAFFLYKNARSANVRSYTAAGSRNEFSWI